MRVQRSRTDALPLTWEVPVAAAGTWLLLAILAFPLGQGVAFVAVGQPFAWPTGRLVESVVALLSGAPGEGLPDTRVGAVPPTVLVYLAVALLQLPLGAFAVWGFGIWWRTIGPGSQSGIASKCDVERVLGASNLRRRRTTIRPDLCGGRRHGFRAGLDG